jgi:hypothetical protein
MLHAAKVTGLAYFYFFKNRWSIANLGDHALTQAQSGVFEIHSRLGRVIYRVVTKENGLESLVLADHGSEGANASASRKQVGDSIVIHATIEICTHDIYTCICKSMCMYMYIYVRARAVSRMNLSRGSQCPHD